MPSIELPHGVVSYLVAGPADSATPPVLFVHPFLMDGSLWSGVADLLAAHGIRSYAPDWPLGAHRTPVKSGTDQSPRGVARQILRFLSAARREDLIDVSTRLSRFAGPVTIVWATADRAFTPELGRRLQHAFGDARFVEVPNARTLLALDAPQQLADAILATAPAHHYRRPER